MTETEVERLVVRLIGDSSSYRNMMTEAGSAVDKTSQAVQNHNRLLGNFSGGISTVTRSLTPLLLMATSLVGITSVLGAATFGIHLANEAEQAEVAFGSMLKSTEKAKQLLEDLQTFAAATPFEFPQLKVAAKSLLAAGFGAGELVPMLRNIGDATGAMGTGAEGVQRATYALMQMRNSGRILGGDMMQLVNAGIPAQKILASALGKTTEQIQRMADSGQLGKREMIKFFEAFKSGKGFEDFAGGMEKQSQTVSGLFSTLKDNVGIALTKVGKILVDALGLKDLINFASENIAKYTDILVSGIQSVVNFVSPIVKTLWGWLSADGGVTAGVLAFIATLGLLVGPITAVAGFLMSMFSPFIIGAMAAGAVISLLINSFGGFEATWKAIQPIVTQTWNMIMDGALAVYELITGTFDLMSSYVSEVWNAMGMGGLVTFSSIRQFLLTVLITAEFAFKNMGQIASVLWTNLQYGAVKTFNQIIYFLTVAVPAGVRWLQDNWQNIFVTLGSNTLTLFENLGTNIKMVWEQVLNYLQGGDFELDWTPLTKGFINTVSELPDIPERVIGEMEKNLGQQAKVMNDALGADFNAFHTKRMDKLMPEDLGISEVTKAADRVAYDAGKDLGKGIGKGIKAASPFDAAIAGSKEAADHMATYLMGATKQPSVTMTPVQKQTQEAKKSNDHLEAIKSKLDTLIGVTRDSTDVPVVLSSANLV